MKKVRRIPLFIATAFFLTIFSGIHVKAANPETTMYNIVIFVRFKGEPEFINNTITKPETGGGTREVLYREIVENTYNASSYSMQSYYRALSNQKLKLKTIYLYDTDDQGKPCSFELKRTRGYYSPISDIDGKNTEGYAKNQFDSRWKDWTDDWGDAVNEAMENGTRFSTWNGMPLVIAPETLDSDEDGWIDSINVIYPKASAASGYSTESGDLLWPCQGDNARISMLTLRREIIYSRRFSQSGVEFNDRSVFVDDQGKCFITPATTIHETGHVMGFNDLYHLKNSEKDRPVAYMSPMAKQLSPVTQFMTSYERAAKGWLTKENIKEIRTSGAYELPPVRDTRQEGIVAYKIKVPGKANKWIYLEYRYTDDKSVNKFNAANPEFYRLDGTDAGKRGGRPDKSGLLMYLVNADNRFPENYDKKESPWDVEVLGGTQDNRSDAPRSKDDPALEYAGIRLKVKDADAEKITFTVTGIEPE